MSISHMNLVWKHSTQGGTRRLLILAIADYADDSGFAWPGQVALARKCKVSRRQVIRLISDVEAAGELLVVRRKRGNRYAVNVWPRAKQPGPGAEITYCQRCAEPTETIRPTPVQPPPGAEINSIVVRVCPDCAGHIRKLAGLGFATAIIGDMLSRHGAEAFDLESDAGVTSDVTDCHIQSDIAMSHDPSLNNKEPPSKENGADAPSDPDSAWLAEPRSKGRSAILTPGGLAGLSAEQKAAIAGGADPPPATEPGTWQAIMVAAKAKRYRYQHGFGDGDALAFVERFSELSGIKPPMVKQEARRWHAGAVTSLYNGWAQFKDEGLSHRDMMRRIIWCLDLFFQEYSPLAFVTATSPHSLINLMGKLAAEMRAIQKDANLGSELPTDEQARAYYGRQTKGKGRKPTMRQPDSIALAAMRAAMRTSTDSGDPLTAARQSNAAN